ncbi:DNA replication/repair protein RecF [Parenemella sanctibonifatiensis]|uniref:DNA replication and repair protein RecF n=1 Tax=Parenemella sanctibonifatiensis TaxID=2016505 RepID=A0A255EKZ8_9ACTN|nr:DNA replication/repair protein RecF [Parenemella sanctibonifatiensis]OYN90285.1 DNA replication/repair protein RecF [Parenemella sanctibonifatiensis]
MYVDHLSLGNFRSYEALELGLEPGVNVFVGLNGQGKTNLVEAIEYAATLASHRVSSDVPLIRAGQDQAIIRARVRAGLEDDRSLTLELELNRGKANRARLNRSPVQRPRELLGLVRVVVFSPEDLAIVKGDPGQRRAFMDTVVITRWPRMAGVRSDFERVLKQRGTLLKSLSPRSHRRTPDPDADSTLAVWNDQLAHFGAEIIRARLDVMADLLPYATQAYADIAPTNNVVTSSYLGSVELPDPDLDRDGIAELLLAAMAQRRDEEVQRGVNLVGPHRDDVELKLGELPARGYASHGESWSLALSLKLGSFHLLRHDGIEPVLILDDVFAELDTTRRERLADGVRVGEQVLVTAAVPHDVPEALAGTSYAVRTGEVSRE